MSSELTSDNPSCNAKACKPLSMRVSSMPVARYDFSAVQICILIPPVPVCVTLNRFVYHAQADLRKFETLSALRVSDHPLHAEIILGDVRPL